MQIHKNEITTGILVLLTLGGFVLLLIIVGMPGILKPLNTYRIYYDNASGIRPGAPVLLAGREIGKVSALHSPVLLADRPSGHPDDEVSIDVQVSRNEPIYRDATVHLTQQGLMGQPVIDFVHEDAGSGLATNHSVFVGDRIPDVSEAVSKNMDRLFGPASDLTATIKNAKIFMESLNNGDITQMMRNTEEFTGVLKREPWRLIWPEGAKKPDDPSPPSGRNKSKRFHFLGS